MSKKARAAPGFLFRQGGNGGEKMPLPAGKTADAGSGGSGGVSGKSPCRPGFLFRQGSNGGGKCRPLMEKLRTLAAEEAAE